MTDSANEPGSVDKKPAPRSKSFRVGIWVAVIVGVAALLSAFIFPVCSAVSREAKQTRNMVFGREIVTALEKYADEHAATLPASLQELIPTYLTEERLAQLAFVDPDSGQRYEWLYFPQTAPSPQAITIVLASPMIGTRIVVSMDQKKHLLDSRFLTETAFFQERPDQHVNLKAP